MDMFQKAGMDLFGFVKSSCVASLNVLATIQEQSARVLGMLIEQGISAQREGRKIMDDWLAAMRKGREDFQKLTEENFRRIEEFLTNGRWVGPAWTLADIGGDTCGGGGPKGSTPSKKK